MEAKKNNRKIVFAVAALVVVIAILAGIYMATRKETSKGGKSVTVEVVHKDGGSKSFSYQTDREYLGEVLADEKLVEGEEGPYGLFIKTVDGETADDANQEWWCLTKEGGQVNTSADQAPIADGDKYELTLTVGY